MERCTDGWYNPSSPPEPALRGVVYVLDIGALLEVVVMILTMREAGVTYHVAADLRRSWFRCSAITLSAL